ncbi:hypothetical protein [Streptomyces sp. NPDC048659]|uniref:hypothetical protein n=1 Tax=Streptomyces sp. NPDC048659 TaxID=3155489 RepID=UPI00344094F0
MDTAEPVTGTYPPDDRQPLLTLHEARRVVALLLHFEDDTDEGREAGQLAVDLACRLPAE